MNRLNKVEKFFVFFLLIWTLFHLILWVTAREAVYTQKDLFWPFLHGSHIGVAYAYDFREFIIYTFVPWALFFMIDGVTPHHSTTKR